MKQNIFGITIFLSFLASCGSDPAKTEEILNKSLDSLSISEISTEIRSNPKNADLFMKRAELYYLLNKADSAISDAEIATRLDSLKPDFFIRLSEMCLLSGHSEKAKNCLEKCNRINPGNSDVLVKIATIYFYVKDYKKSVEYLDQAASYNPRDANMFFLRGMIHQQKKEPNAAILNFQKATECNPEFYDAFMMLGLIYGEKNDSVTIQYYQTASKLKPEEIQPHYNLGLFYQDNESFDEAIYEYQYILQNLDKSYPHAFFNQGYIYMIYLKEYDKAISYFDSSLAVKPDYVEAIYNKGFCYEKQKNYIKARELYNQAKEMVTNYQLAIDGLNRLDKKNKN
jgi:tetratricopeptide (TPR) repeat protein